MATIWDILKKYAKQIGLTYNASGKTYNEAYTNYDGKLATIWTNRTKN